MNTKEQKDNAINYGVQRETSQPCDIDELLASLVETVYILGQMNRAKGPWASANVVLIAANRILDTYTLPKHLEALRP